jgi:hypothetical protein
LFNLGLRSKKKTGKSGEAEKQRSRERKKGRKAKSTEAKQWRRKEVKKKTEER